MASVDELENLFFKKARGENWSLEDIGVLGKMDRVELNRQVARAGQVLKYQTIAGTAQDREVARQRLGEAESRLKNETPDIEGAISELQRKKSELEAAVKSAREQVATHERAVVILRESIPHHVAKFHANSKQLVSENYGRMRELKSRVQILRSIPQIDIATYEGAERAKTHAQGYGQDDVIDTEITTGPGGTYKRYSVNPKRWAAYVAELQDELPNAERELAALQSEYDREMSELESLREIYVM